MTTSRKFTIGKKHSQRSRNIIFRYYYCTMRFNCVALLWLTIRSITIIALHQWHYQFNVLPSASFGQRHSLHLPTFYQTRSQSPLQPLFWKWVTQSSGGLCHEPTVRQRRKAIWIPVTVTGNSFAKLPAALSCQSGYSVKLSFHFISVFAWHYGHIRSLISKKHLSWP